MIWSIVETSSVVQSTTAVQNYSKGAHSLKITLHQESGEVVAIGGGSGVGS